MRFFFLTLATALLFAVPAQATLTRSNITSPTDPSFLVDNGTGATVTISGTSDGAATDKVDIICTYGADIAAGLAPAGNFHNVAVQPGGSFSTTVPMANGFADFACRLHAIPAGPAPANLAPFTGPRVGWGSKTVAQIPGSSLSYDLEATPFGGFYSLEDLRDCSLVDAYAEDPATNDFQIILDCGNGLSEEADTFDRSQILVDGANAYDAGELSMVGESYPGDPLPTLSVNPANGQGSVSAQRTLAKCSPVGYPLTAPNCTSDVPVGVRVDHTAQGLGGGELVVSNDTFVSIDGQAHDVDLLYEEKPDSLTPTYRLPGETTFSAHNSPDQISALGSGPAAITFGDPGKNYGVIAWATTPQGLTFFDPNIFEIHHLIHVPAGGSTTLSYAFGVAFTLDQANAVETEAINAVSPPAPPPPPLPPAPAKTRLKFSTKSSGNGTVTVTFNAPAAGSLSGLETAVVPRSAKKRTKKLTVSRARKKASKAGKIKLDLKLNKKGRKLFRAKHKLPVTLTLSFKPKVGSATKLAPKHLTLKLKQKHKSRKH
jgi:hypothetical protein